MNEKRNVYIGTVGLDRNRWGSRVPSIKISDWLERFETDGFDGVELWEYHYLKADEAEQERLAEAAPFAVFNSYVGFDDESADARAESARAIARLQAGAVKYNLGNDAAKLQTYRQNLLAWAEALPASCKLLCECHGGTLLEEIDGAADFFRELDPARFGVIVHLSGNPDDLSQRFEAFGDRVQHVHVQLRGPGQDPTIAANRPSLDACFEVLKKNRYRGPIALEFSRGIGREEETETIYQNTCQDLAYVRDASAKV